MLRPLFEAFREVIFFALLVEIPLKLELLVLPDVEVEVPEEAELLSDVEVEVPE